jgi:hypothetical protein
LVIPEFEAAAKERGIGGGAARSMELPVKLRAAKLAGVTRARSDPSSLIRLLKGSSPSQIHFDKILEQDPKKWPALFSDIMSL